VLYPFLFRSQYVLSQGGNLSERPANRLYTGMKELNCILAFRMQFVQSFHHFFIAVLRRHIFQWETTLQKYIELVETAEEGHNVAPVLMNALRENLLLQRLQNKRWYLGIQLLGTLVHRDYNSGVWSRISEDDLQAIIAQEGYVKKILIAYIQTALKILKTEPFR